MLVKMAAIFRIAFRSLFQQKLRSVLSILGVVCGVMAVLAMVAISEGVKQEVLAQIERLGIRNIYLRSVSLTEGQALAAREKRAVGLKATDLQHILAACPDVERAGALVELTAAVQGSAGRITPQVVAVSSNYARLQNLFLARGRFLSDLDVRRRNLVCVLGYDAARAFKAGSVVPGNLIRVQRHLFRLVGILARVDQQTTGGPAISTRDYNTMVFVPLGSEKTLHQNPKNRPPGELSEIVIQVSKTDRVLGVARIIRRTMEVFHHGAADYRMVVPLELLRESEKTQRTFSLFLGAIASVSLLVGGIGIMNIMLATVSERIREIGIRRAVGATRGDIVAQFLIEAVVLTGFGGILGILAGVAAVYLVSSAGRWHTAITVWAIILPLAMSLLVGIFFGLYPAYKAARLDPAEAFRQG